MFEKKNTVIVVFSSEPRNYKYTGERDKLQFDGKALEWEGYFGDGTYKCNVKVISKLCIGPKDKGPF